MSLCQSRFSYGDDDELGLVSMSNLSWGFPCSSDTHTHDLALLNKLLRVLKFLKVDPGLKGWFTLKCTLI